MRIEEPERSTSILVCITVLHLDRSLQFVEVWPHCEERKKERTEVVQM